MERGYERRRKMGENSLTTRLERADIPSALELSNLAGWNQTERDWQTLLDLEPDGCFAIKDGNRLLATTTLLCYEKRLAWLGMVLTHPDFQRRGFARRLVTAALALAEQRGVRTVKLDATAFGQPLYESLGFRSEQTIERWSRPFAQTGGPSEHAWQTAERLDEEAFSVNRSRLFAAFRSYALLRTRDDGFVLTRPGSRAAYLGPFVARNLATAGSLIQECLAQDQGPWFWDLFPANPSAVALAAECGFRRERSLVRMTRGEKLPQDTSLSYGIAGFEFG